MGYTEVIFKDSSNKKYRQVPAGWISFEVNPIEGMIRMIDGEVHYCYSVRDSTSKHKWNPFRKTQIESLWCPVETTNIKKTRY